MKNTTKVGMLSLALMVGAFAQADGSDASINANANNTSSGSTFVPQADLPRIDASQLIQRKLLNETGQAQPKIVGGTNINPSDAPNFVSVIISASNGTFLCGGTILDARHILTAAHCVSNGGGDDAPASIVFALTSPDGVSGGSIVYDESYSSQAVIVHPQYTNLTNNDIAVLRLNESIAGYDASRMQTILNNGLGDLAGTTGTVIGMGSTSSSGGSPNSLQRVDLPIIANSRCESTYGIPWTNKVCAGFTDNTQRDSCQGDSGGPLNVNRNGQNVQAGIVSFGSSAGCAGGDPGGYTRVSSYVDFIKTNASGAVVLGEEGGSAVSRISSVSGLWYDRNYNGSGFNVTRPNANTLIMYHYGYTGSGNGDTKWIYMEVDLSDATVRVGQPYEARTFSGFLGNGASFNTPPNDPPGITNWGAATITFNSCNSATAVLDGEDGQLSYNLIRLGFEFGQACEVN